LWDNAELLEDLLHADQLKHIDGQDAYVMTFFCYCVLHLQTQLIGKFFNHIICLLSSWGRTPLHAAATTENSSCLRILLQSGGNYLNEFVHIYHLLSTNTNMH